MDNIWAGEEPSVFRIHALFGAEDSLQHSPISLLGSSHGLGANRPLQSEALLELHPRSLAEPKREPQPAGRSACLEIRPFQILLQILLPGVCFRHLCLYLTYLTSWRLISLLPAPCASHSPKLLHTRSPAFAYMELWLPQPPHAGFAEGNGHQEPLLSRSLCLYLKPAWELTWYLDTVFMIWDTSRPARAHKQSCTSQWVLIQLQHDLSLQLVLFQGSVPSVPITHIFKLRITWHF